MVGTASAFITVVLAGVLTGSELTSWGIVHPTLWKLEHHSQVRAEKLMYRRFASIDPFLMTGTAVAPFIAAGFLGRRSSALMRVGGACFAAMVGLTLVGNMPPNLRVFRWDEQHGDPAEWRHIRRRWDQIHTGRIVLDSAGFLLVALAAVTA
jgi:hypothetical protein